MFEIAPSVLAADPLFVARDVKKLIDAGISLLHLDIMDGHFVPNISFGPAMVESLHRHFPEVTLDVHLMLSEPGGFIDPFIKAGANEITIHSEIDGDIGALLGRIRKAGLRAGLSIKPGTDYTVLLPFLGQIDLVLLMSVEPGFGGQKFISTTVSRVAAIKAECDRRGVSPRIEVDGGINTETASLCAQAGASVLVMGSAFFKAQDRTALAKQVRAL